MNLSGAVYRCGPCPYLPDREFQAFQPDDLVLTARYYRFLMDQRFRRSGGGFYMPTCPDCTACQPIRVDVAAFEPRRDQQRVLRRNTDLIVSWHPRGMDAERRALYERYQRSIHDKDNDGDPSEFLAVDGGVDGGELHACDSAGTLLAVSVCDRFPDALSSVYCYWEPAAAARGLGTFMALAEIAHARSQNMQWLYLGFLVEACSKMAYKARFTPCEVLVNGAWERRE